METHGVFVRSTWRRCGTRARWELSRASGEKVPGEGRDSALCIGTALPLATKVVMTTKALGSVASLCRCVIHGFGLRLVWDLDTLRLQKHARSLKPTGHCTSIDRYS